MSQSATGGSKSKGKGKQRQRQQRRRQQGKGQQQQGAGRGIVPKNGPVPSGANARSLNPGVLTRFTIRRVFTNAEPCGVACALCQRDLNAVRGTLLVALPCCGTEVHQDCSYAYFGVNKGCPKPECSFHADLSAVPLPDPPRQPILFNSLDAAMLAALEMHSADLATEDISHAQVSWQGVSADEHLRRGNMDIALDRSRRPYRVRYLTMPREHFEEHTDFVAGCVVVKIFLRMGEADKELDDLVRKCNAHSCPCSNHGAVPRSRVIHTIGVHDSQYILQPPEQTIAAYYTQQQEELEARTWYA